MADFKTEIVVANNDNYFHTDGGGNNSPRSKCYFKTSDYPSGSTFYFEVIYQNWETTDQDIYLKNSNGTTEATLTATANDQGPTRIRTATSFSPNDSYPEKYLSFEVPGGSSGCSVNIARVIVFQTTGTGMTKTETQHALGGAQANTLTTLYGCNGLAWKYTEGDFDGTTKTFEVETTWYVSNSKLSMTIYLQEDNGSFTWSNLLTLVNGGTNTSPTRVRASFSPTTGRHYRLAWIQGSSKYYGYHSVTRIIIRQTSTGTITKTEASMGLSINGFSYQLQTTERQRYVDTEYTSGIATFYNVEYNPLASVGVKLQYNEDGTWTDISGTSISGSNYIISSAFTPPAGDHEIGPYYTSGFQAAYVQILIKIVIPSEFVYAGSITATFTLSSTYEGNPMTWYTGKITVSMGLSSTTFYVGEIWYDGLITMSMGLQSASFCAFANYLGQLIMAMTISATYSQQFLEYTGPGPSGVAFWVDEGETRLLEVLLANRSPDSVLYLGLYCNTADPTDASNLAWVTEPSGGGYERKPLNRGDWIINGNIADGMPTSFHPTSGTWGAVYGYFISTEASGTAGKMLAIEEFKGAPYNISVSSYLTVFPRIVMT